MSKEFKNMADQALGGLEAGPVLWQKITLEAAEQAERNARPKAIWKPMLAGGLAVAMAAAAVFTVLPAKKNPVGTDTAIVQTLSAGANDNVAAVAYTEAPFAMKAGVQSGSALFAGEGEDGLVIMDGSAYRMTADTVAADLLGNELGTVMEFSLQPSLSDGKAVSSVVPNGGTVYTVKGMEGILAAAEVDGAMHLFQRVSYLGRTGADSLEQLLCTADEVAAFSVNGTVYEGEAAQKLFAALVSDAELLSSGSAGEGELLITMTNGLKLRFWLGDETVSACGTWYCPDFFEAAGL